MSTALKLNWKVTKLSQLRPCHLVAEFGGKYIYFKCKFAGLIALLSDGRHTFTKKILLFTIRRLIRPSTNTIFLCILFVCAVAIQLKDIAISHSKVWP